METFERTWTREEFAAFLRKDPTRLYKTGLVRDCPLAVFLATKLNRYVEVLKNSISIRTSVDGMISYPSIKPESWEYDFICAVDANGRAQSISGEKALSILNAISDTVTV